MSRIWHSNNLTRNHACFKIVVKVVLTHLHMTEGLTLWHCLLLSYINKCVRSYKGSIVDHHNQVGTYNAKKSQITQLTFPCSKSTIETLEKSVKL